MLKKNLLWRKYGSKKKNTWLLFRWQEIMDHVRGRAWQDNHEEVER